MEAIDRLENSSAPVSAQDTADKENTTPIDAGGVAVSDFSAFMRQALGESKTQVNEEELFAAVVQERLAQENPEAEAYFVQMQSQYINSMRRADGYVPVEDAAVAALNATVEAGHIDATVGARINAESFRAAQLDDDHTALFDSHGSAGDATIAVMDIESALARSQAVLDEINGGTLEPDNRPLDTPSNSISGGGSSSHTDSSSGPSVARDGAGGFLWKPVSEADGKLVVLLPTDLKGAIDKVEIHSELPPSPDSLLEKGRFTGDTHNGGRPHFRFDQPGEAYGDNVHLVVFRDDGSTVTYDIDNGGDRHD